MLGVLKKNKAKVIFIVLALVLSFYSVNYLGNFISRFSVYNMCLGSAVTRVNLIKDLSRRLPEKEQDEILISLHKVLYNSDAGDLINGKDSKLIININEINLKVIDLNKLNSDLALLYNSICNRYVVK